MEIIKALVWCAWWSVGLYYALHWLFSYADNPYDKDD